MKILIALGTRPEVIKLVPIILALRGRAEVRICASGQHREMLAQTLGAFSLVPDIQLDTMSPGRSLNILASRQLSAFDEVFEQEKPDWVVVQGDTTTAFCAGLAAFHQGIRVAHVEAGLRTGDLASPFPEEANRSLLGRITTLHCAPTNAAQAALRIENVPADAIVVTGNTVVDAIYQASESWAEGKPETLSSELDDWTSAAPYVLLTCHRRENFGDIMENICHMIARLCQRHPDLHWIFPVHLNPAVSVPVRRILGQIPNLLLTDPVDYHTSLYLIKNARLVISDSGGIQEEAPTFGTPVVVMREHTERMEGVKAGFATLAGQSPERIEEAVDYWLTHPEAVDKLKQLPNPYGDGHAATRIADALLGLPVETFCG
ncbi:TPA: UDP-N-acetylglucosamine 2-epimerase (non-hydrolyzing) [Klebsiella quasipneumoniae]|uniref:non-hydrolyzing UDP-N-acetylglucosamine 2-epimerase n=1 Tax=Enterobacter asburiae TaxID=61645 RepID=UPI0014332108|nr:UDP-N-acetylglucosamine 2-epimerase (non-hydrolyzing) [Enterobacter asburiae]NKD22856.1 UDP-N-acetylglucosamine 2-epimerase (non-hydrolyzing) [Enterobacter asburiae]HBQ8794208.1 UDP-N-acetylglucosamine 2-epimerase (non-hydrolyzing) [Klebsiella quasipneumoniae]